MGCLILPSYWVRSSGKFRMRIRGQNDMQRRLGNQNCLGQKGKMRMTVALSYLFLWNTQGGAVVEETHS